MNNAKGRLQLVGVGKAFRRFLCARDRYLEVLSLGWIKRHQPHWILRGINLTVEPGMALGIIGYNGAGKSTLLKLITGVLQPTEGRVHVSGRVSAILELGVGMHPELSGRDNILLAGQLLGFSASELEAQREEIIEFSGLGDMINEPVKAYSSGMQARLAFSIATAIRPDILIVDEALSVGDAYFQHKSFARIQQFRAAGTSILFVSHDFSAVRTLCDRALLLADGAVVREGVPADVLDYYHALIAETERLESIQQEERDGRTVTLSGTSEAEVLDVEILDASSGCVLKKIPTAMQVSVVVSAKSNVDLSSLVVGIMIRDRAGNPVYGTNTWQLGRLLKDLPAGAKIRAEFCFPANFGVGSYNLTVALTGGETHLEKNYAWCDNALVFEVVNLSCPPFVGVAWVPAEASVEVFAS